MTRLVDIGIAVRSTEENPWFARLMDSLQAKRPGLPAEILVESAPELTKVEKQLRIFRRSRARMLCLLEDDAEVLHEDWLAQMVCHMSVMEHTAILNPQETRQALSQESAGSLLRDEVLELTNVAGFCVLIDRESGVEPDVRVQTMDDLWMSLRARAQGWRNGKSGGALLRHSKAPWADDNLLPWEQGDRSRFGEGHAYYDRGRHEARQRMEARLMVEVFGDLARLTLPARLLPWADPLHTDFGMAWDRGQPIDYRTTCEEKVSFLLPYIGNSVPDGGIGRDEALARGRGADAAPPFEGAPVARSEGARGIRTHAQASAL